MEPYMVLLPQALLLLTGLLVLLMKIIVGDRRGNFYLALFGSLIALFSTLQVSSGMNPPGIHVDPFGLLMTRLIIITLLGVFCYSLITLNQKQTQYTEWSVLLTLAALGLTLMANTHHLLVIFVGLELSSLAFYVLCGYMRRDHKGLEASLKYFVMGSVGSAIILLGMALVYAHEGTLLMTEVGLQRLPTQTLWLSVFVVVLGFLFKLSLVPMHFWVPDVYEGAPTQVTAFMSVAVKMAVFAVLIRMLTLYHGIEWIPWSSIFWWFALGTILLANLFALVQESVKRMLAYSSIAHAGYLMLGLVALSPDGFTAIVFYLTVYMVMNILAFGVVELASTSGDYLYDDLRGLSLDQPVLAFALAIAMISLTGLPPTAGFMGKLMLFRSVVEAGYVSLAIVAVFGSLLSVGYYFRVIIYAYIRSPLEDQDEIRATPVALSRATSVAGLIFLLIIGFFPNWIYQPIGMVVDILGGLSL